MELYFKNSEGQLQETKLIQVLENAFSKAGFNIDNGVFDGENFIWTGVVQKSKNSTEVIVNICFEEDGNAIIKFKVFETPIKTVIDDNNMRQII